MFTSQLLRRGRCLVAIALGPTLACFSPSPYSARPAVSGHELLHAEIESHVFLRTSSLYDVVHVLRPNMLVARYQARAAQSAFMPAQFADGIKVYLDGMLFGGVESLRLIPASSVRSVRQLSGIDATTRFGTGHTNGVIVVTSTASPR